ncbi:MAG: type II toxin-antitoxin system Phd/YefM family antitoxin [Acidimicrobiales bacterium]
MERPPGRFAAPANTADHRGVRWSGSKHAGIPGWSDRAVGRNQRIWYLQPWLQYDKLGEAVDAMSTTDEVVITKNGTPGAVLIGADEWESIQETLFWLSQPDIRESVSEADHDPTFG